MAKHHRPSLEAFAQPVTAAEPPVASTNVVGFPAEGQGAKPAVKRPHTTLYLDKRVQKAIKEIALQYDRKPHDLYLEGIELMLEKYGKSTAEITK